MWLIQTFDYWRDHLVVPAAFAIAICTALVSHHLLFRALKIFAERESTGIYAQAVSHFHKPARWIIVAIALRLTLDAVRLSAGPENLVKTTFGIAMILLVSWSLIKTTFLLDGFIAQRFQVGVKDNLRARKIHTQMKVLRRIIIAVILIIASATILMTFPKVRQLGTTILASAGIIGLVVGLAAQKTLSTFIAGLQIAFTQPIRLDDVVIVEGEWGRIEEITLTYVVVRIWDMRRLIVPITYFIEKPFQNWTRVSADILGTVFLHVDHSVPTDAVRAELKRILENSEWWDGKVCVLHVTDTTERTVELRALMSAGDSSAAWNLRCEVRERLIDFIRISYPHALPRLRAELKRD
jgi:small-conductance mechanosensitive channel